MYFHHVSKNIYNYFKIKSEMACGCSQSSTFMQGGSPKGVKLEKEKVDDLYAKARKYNIRGRSKMNKAELVAAIRKAQKELGEKLSKRRH